MSTTTENDLQEALRGMLMNDDDGQFRRWLFLVCGIRRHANLGMAMEEALADGRDDEAPLIDGCRTFLEAGLLTCDRGLVLRLTDGSEFQITIKRSN